MYNDNDVYTEYILHSKQKIHHAFPVVVAWFTRYTYITADEKSKNNNSEYQAGIPAKFIVF